MVGGRWHRRAGGGWPLGLDAVGRPEAARGRRVQLSEAAPLSDGGGRPRPLARGLARETVFVNCYGTVTDNQICEVRADGVREEKGLRGPGQ